MNITYFQRQVKINQERRNKQCIMEEGLTLIDMTERINNNLAKIVNDLEIIKPKQEEKIKEDEGKLIAKQEEQYFYSTVIPSLKLGKIIKIYYE